MFGLVRLTDLQCAVGLYSNETFTAVPILILFLLPNKDLHIVKNTHTHIYIYICIHTHVSTYIYIHIHTRIYIYIYTRIYIYIYIVKNIYTYLHKYIHNTHVTKYTGCPGRNVKNFGRVFLMLKYKS
jgi:hypothetical protein